jgi:hypothetical protein
MQLGRNAVKNDVLLETESKFLSEALRRDVIGRGRRREVRQS